MNIWIRRSIGTVCAVLGTLSATVASAETFPERPIRWILPFTAGGPSDSMARMLSRIAAPVLNGYQPTVDNRPGGSAVVGTQLVVTSKPDGYTIGTIGDNHAINPLLMSKMPYKVDDVEPVMGVLKVPLLLVTRGNLEANNLQEAIRLFKANPGKYSYGSWGTASSAHLATERLADAIGTEFVHVPYPGTPQEMQALIAGDLDFALVDAGVATPHLKAGRVKVLAVSAAERMPQFPDVPAIAEAIPGFSALAWNAIAAPKGLPPALLARLTKVFQDSARSPEVVKFVSERGFLLWAGPPEDVKAQMSTDAANAQAIIKKRNIRLE